jgi:hypothetical protein
MTLKGFLYLSLTLLAVSVCGFFGTIFFHLANFTHKGNDLDWTYTVGGLFVLLGCGSAILVVISIVLAANEKRHEKTDSSDFKLTH